MVSTTLCLAAALLAGSAKGTTTYPNCNSGPLKHNLACDTKASPADRAAAAVRAMNITEKLQNLVDVSLGASRVGLPAYEWWSEALHGVASSPGLNFSSSGQYSYATSFAMPITFSSAFDDNMVQEIASIISTEARAFSNVGRAGLDFFTPNINPYRDPRWGRGSETPGEDPFRIKNYVNALLQGLEGGINPPKKKVVATCKHFAGYDLEDWDGQVRYGFNAVITSQDLAEYYLPPFQQCARDNQVGSVMCSYNAVNGVPSCANSYLMEDILRKHWGWTTQNQYITSDCNAVSNIYENHKYVQTNEESVGVAWAAGTDNACQAGDYVNITGSYALGLLTNKMVDTSLNRMYESLVRLGYFDPAGTNPYREYSWSDVNTANAQQLALESATKSLVLLKNNGALPMALTGKKVAAIGMWANGTTNALGGYSGPPPYFHNPLYALNQRGLHVNYATGPINESTATGNWTADALKAAKASDVILYFGGIDGTVESEAMDRYQIAWPASQLALIKQICALGKPCVVVQMGDQLDQTPLLNNKNVSAIMWAGFPGQSGGTAAVQLLTGQVAPAGRLPVTQYPADYVNQVPMTDMSLRPGTDNPGRTYKWYKSPVFPFGYGLHYTTFKASFQQSAPDYDIQSIISGCSEKNKDLCTLPALPIAITNTGKTTSDYVTLLFSSTTAGPSPAPLKSLVAYQRLSAIAAGQTQTASLTIKLGELARRTTNGNLVVYPGIYNLMVDTTTKASIKLVLSGSQVTLENWPQPPANQTA